ncbi:MAG: SWIM zinc finger family protein [Candidatus Micrarchaeaceae archaeon]
MQIQELLKIRKQKGYEIAKTNKIVQKDKKWIVPSQTSNKKYEVTLYLDKKVCTCLDYTERGMTCKHIFAVEITITKEVDNYGNVKETKIVRKTYPQDWANYNKAQINQKELFLKLLFDLCKSIPQERKHLGKGRPEIPMKDVVFSSALKIFTTFSLRRFGSDMKTAKELGYVEKAPYFSVVSKYMQKEELTPILQELIALSSMPLK